MELKYSNSNGEIVLASILNFVDLFFELWKSNKKKNPNSWVFEEVSMIDYKIESSIIFTSLIQME